MMKNLIAHLQESLRIGLNDKPESIISNIFDDYEYEIKSPMYKRGALYAIHIGSGDRYNIYHNICDVIRRDGSLIHLDEENKDELVYNGKIIASIDANEIHIESKTKGKLIQMRIYCYSDIIMNLLLDVSELFSPSYNSTECYEISSDLFNELSTFIHDNDKETEENIILIS